MTDRNDIEKRAKAAVSRCGARVIQTTFVGTRQAEFRVEREGRRGRATVLFNSDLIPHVYFS